MLKTCKVKLYPKTGSYSISGGRGIQLVGVKGRWAEVLEEGDVKYTVSSESGETNTLRDRFGNILLTIDSKKTQSTKRVNKVCSLESSVKGSYPFIRSALLPDIDLDNDLPNSENLALLLCDGKL